MMDKTININIAGTLFQIDEDAFIILRNYLQAINNRFRNAHGGLETIEDIEYRIAEILRANKGLAGVITRANVESMISIIGNPEDFDIQGNEEEYPHYSSQRKRMYRNPSDSIISGVCGGIGAYLNTDPVLFRILFVLFTVFFGIGFFVYIALWIALPPANNEARRKEMFGNNYYSERIQNKQFRSNNTVSSQSSSGYNGPSGISNAVNEVFRAIGRVFFIVLRIFLIIIGTGLVLTGFLAILAFIMVFVFKLPNAFTMNGFDMTLTNMLEFMNYIVAPASGQWIIALTSIAFLLPMIAIIYWGVKMIFWFNAKDGIISLVGLVVWVMTLAALAVVLFNEGISFAETSSATTQNILAPHYDTLYIKVNKQVSGLRYDKNLNLKQEGYNVYINEEKKELYISPYLNITSSDDNNSLVVKKRSSARSKMEAVRKTEELSYNCHLSSDTLFLDEYFTIPSGRKWSNDIVSINLKISESTVFKIDPGSEKLLYTAHYKLKGEHIDPDTDEQGLRSWILTEKGLKPLTKHTVRQE